MSSLRKKGKRKLRFKIMNNRVPNPIFKNLKGLIIKSLTENPEEERKLKTKNTPFFHPSSRLFLVRYFPFPKAYYYALGKGVKSAFKSGGIEEGMSFDISRLQARPIGYAFHAKKALPNVP